jgi:hypothetical protein
VRGLASLRLNPFFLYQSLVSRFQDSHQVCLPGYRFGPGDESSAYFTPTRHFLLLLPPPSWHAEIGFWGASTLVFLEISMFLFRHCRFDVYDYCRMLFTGTGTASLNKIRIDSFHYIIVLLFGCMFPIADDICKWKMERKYIFMNRNTSTHPSTVPQYNVNRTKLC